MVILKLCHIYLFIIDLLEPLVYWHYKGHDHTTVRWITIKTGAFWKVDLKVNFCVILNVKKVHCTISSYAM